MNEIFRFTVPGPIPSLNNVYKRRLIKAQRNPFEKKQRGLYITDEGKAFKQSVGWSALVAARNQRLALDSDHFFQVNITLRKGATWDECLRRDADNVIKLTLDAMEGIVYANDRVVIDKIVRKRPGTERGTECLEIEVIRLGAIPAKGSDADHDPGAGTP